MAKSVSPSQKAKLTLYRCQWIFDTPQAHNLRYIENGAMVVDERGVILNLGPYSQVKKDFPKAKIVDFGKHSVITPGFVDCHVHAPQLEKTGAGGYQS